MFRIVVKIEQRQRTGCADICRGRVRHSAAPGSQRPAPAGIQPRAGAALIAARRPITSPLRSPEINEAASRRDVVSRSRSNVVNLDRMAPALGLGGCSAPGPRLGNVAVADSDVRIQADHIRGGGAVLFCSLPIIGTRNPATLNVPKGSGTRGRGGGWSAHRRVQCIKMESK